MGKNNTQPKKKLVRATSAIRRSNAHSELDLRGQRYDEAMTNLDRYIVSAFIMALGNCFENGRDRDCYCNGL